MKTLRLSMFLVVVCIVIFSMISLKKDSRAERQAFIDTNQSLNDDEELDRTDPTAHTLASIFPELPKECQPFVMDNAKSTMNRTGTRTSTLDDSETPTRQTLNFKRHATFAPNHDLPLYDHSCFAMKARYNCAVAPGLEPEFGDSAHDWKLVLEQKNMDDGSAERCDFRKAVDSLGGPLGIASLLQARRQKLQNDPHTRPVNLLLMGSSYLRQVWESITCQYKELITDGFFQDGGPLMSMAAFRDRKGKKVGLDELGDLLPFTAETNQGCQGAAKDFGEFYRPNVEGLSEERYGKENCNDNLAMVELNHQLRLWFVFRPSSMEHLGKTLEWMGLPLNHVDHVIWNESYHDVRKLLLEVGIIDKPLLETKHYNVKTSWVKTLPFLRIVQAKKRPFHYFGANNPWIYKPPDGHPCMPGIPDDEVALLLFTLAYNVNLNV